MFPKLAKSLGRNVKLRTRSPGQPTTSTPIAGGTYASRLGAARGLLTAGARGALNMLSPASTRSGQQYGADTDSTLDEDAANSMAHLTLPMPQCPNPR
ncbi:hypothetical protein SKAU_G00131090 [Synaphobranchus kaupii]|uniref:Uncharacterized protein n=1 Tax=Synaphobranchus kaupii TaxID=118154 RepID=A0A9Q1J3C4_SYNKA|nr:hypothetical protein SKAU_G00131090 [Synaphobranchus kaupii]